MDIPEFLKEVERQLRDPLPEQVRQPPNRRIQGHKLLEYFPEKEDTQEGVGQILSVSEEERSFKVDTEAVVEPAAEDNQERGNSESDDVEVIESKSTIARTSSGSRTTRSGAAFLADELLSYAKDAKVKTEGLPPIRKKVLETKGVKAPELKAKNASSVMQKRKAIVMKDEDDFKGLTVDGIGDKVVDLLTEQASEIMKKACAAWKAERDALKERAEAAEKEMKDAKAYFRNSATTAMVQARVDLMEQYTRGEHTSWNLEEERALLKSLLDKTCGDADAVEAGEGADVNAGEVDSNMKSAEEVETRDPEGIGDVPTTYN